MDKGIKLKGMAAENKGGLERCPFCGNEPVLIRYQDGVFIKCTFCECMIAKQISVITETILPFDSKDDAVAAWNRRKQKARSWRSNKNDSPDEILMRRNDRADAIAEVIKGAYGDIVYVSEIMEETGMSRSTVLNNMRYAKTRHTEIKSHKGKRGYFWEENLDE